MKETIPATKEQFAENSACMGHQGTVWKLWHYVSRTWALKGWKRWLSWAMRCRLEPMKKAAKTVKNHKCGRSKS